MTQDTRPRQPSDEEPPPFLGNWNNVYLSILLYLAGLIVLFAWFGYAFTPR